MPPLRRACAVGITAFTRYSAYRSQGNTHVEEFRELLWSSVYLLTIKIQLLWVVVVVAQVGPGLIAKDLKTRALPIYFAKPVTPIT